MSDVRTEPLTQDEIATYHEQGFLFPIRVLTDEQVVELREALDDHLEGRRQSQQYELTDPIVDSHEGDMRPIGCSATVFCSAAVGSSWLSRYTRTCSVSMKPGATQFTRTPSFA